MNDKRILSIVLLLVCVQLGRQPLSDHANNLDFAIESKIDALLSKMTLEEKAGQMSQVSKFGEDGPGDIESEVRKGNIGSFLNIAEVGLRNKLQKTITFDLPTPELIFYDINMEYTVEPGDFKVWIGPNSTDGLEGSFELL